MCLGVTDPAGFVGVPEQGLEHCHGQQLRVGELDGGPDSRPVGGEPGSAIRASSTIT